MCLAGENSDTVDMRKANTDDRGTALIGYALIVMLVGITSVVGLKSVGQNTSDSFEAISTSIPGSSIEAEVELTPQEKWDNAKADYTAAIDDAKATKKDAFVQAKTRYKDSIALSKSLPKAEKKAANKIAKTTYKSDKTQANTTYKASVSAAKSTRADAKAEYKATK